MRSFRPRFLICSATTAVVTLAIIVSACAPRAAPVVVEKVVTQVAEKVVEKRVAPTSAPAGPVRAPTAAPAPTKAPAPAVASAQQGAVSDVAPSPYQAGRMIIKNGEMTLLVPDTDRAIDRVTEVAVLNGGYIVSSQSTMRGDAKFASLTLGVPAEQFETVQRQLRAMALRVLADTASGQDVSDEYVDQQSRLLNLEATAARVREFLAQAKTVEEALKVNAQLTEIEAEIEKVKGRMNYLKDRSAYSTLIVNLEPQLPTPTPSPTPTVTSTPTPTTTSTPVVWQPGKTAESAADTLATVMKAFIDVLIWMLIVLGPFVLLAALLIALLLWLRGRRRAAREPKTEEKGGNQ
jgi:hypothetical protein